MGVNVLPPTLLLQYYFNSAGKVRPYVGAGLNYTLFYNNGLHAGDTPVSIKNSSFGPALQAGIDVQVARNLFVNADIKKIWMRTSASAGRRIARFTQDRPACGWRGCRDAGFRQYVSPSTPRA